MFISLPQYEFQMPGGLAEPGTKHWRVVELPLHAPWFLLTVEHFDPDGHDLRVSNTLCFAWDTDLVDAIKTIDANRVLGLVAMMPPWASATGHWSSRQIAEVWLDTDETGKFVSLKDFAGKRLDAGMCGNSPTAVCVSDLLLRLKPRKPTLARPRSSGTGIARRRATPVR